MIDSQILPHCSPVDGRAPSAYSASVAQIEVLNKSPAILAVRVETQHIGVEIAHKTRTAPNTAYITLMPVSSPKNPP